MSLFNGTQPPSPETPAFEALREENVGLKAALERVQETQAELRQLVEQIASTPWHPALYQTVVDTPQGERALVWIGGSPRLVNLHPDLDWGSLACGRYVYLDSARATLMAPSEGEFSPPADSAGFERFTPDGRIVARVRDEELVLEPTDAIDMDSIGVGHRILYDRPSRLALDAMKGAEGAQYQLEELGELPLEAVGGHRETLDDLISRLTATLVEPELARTYRIDGRRSVLLYGPPGCGKTLIARTATAAIQRISGKRCRFAVVRPGEWENSYVGQTEANIRNCFASLREAARDEMAVLFLDEIESIGRSRGAPHGSRHSDRFLAALLAEIDGFCERGEVSIVAATNRRDLLDPALLSRLADTQIAVPRPDLESAREIFGIHLPASLPYASLEIAHREGDATGGQTRAEDFESARLRDDLLDATVARLYAPNADNAVCRLSLRDGTSRVVHARDLMSGRLIEQIAVSIREKAFRRDLANRGRAPGHARGLRTADAIEAVETALIELSTTLSIHNARSYLDDLPQDVDVVRAESIRPQPERSQEFYNVA